MDSFLKNTLGKIEVHENGEICSDKKMKEAN
jgi:hypothetical protein